MAFSATRDYESPLPLHPNKGSLRRAFGKVAAVVALAATIVFYGLGFQISKGFYDQWQENKAGVTATQTVNHTDNLPWVPAGGALGISLAAGFTGIALGRRRNSYGGYSSASGYSSNNDGFFWGYMWGSSGSSSSSSSSSDSGGEAAVLVAGAAIALAASASVVTYKALKANFGEP
jgi:hypothetical protein